MEGVVSSAAENSINPHYEFLRSIKLFSLLDDHEIAALHAVLHERKVAPDELLFSEGEQGDSLYVIQSGSIEVTVNDFAGEKIILASLSRGEIFGETSVFDPGPRSATARATGEGTLFECHRDALLRFLKSKPEASIDLLAMLSRRLREADQLLMGRAAGNVNIAIESKLSIPQRLANGIADFSGSIPFLTINLLVFVAWIVINIEMVPGLDAFDPYPFGFLTMSVSLEAIFLSIIVLLSQNLNSAKERIRNDVEYEINMQAEKKVTELHRRIIQLHNDISRRLSKLETREP